MGAATFTSDINVQGNVVCLQLLPAQACIGNSQINASQAAPIDGAKVSAENPGPTSAVELFGASTTIASVTKGMGMGFVAGTLLVFQAFIEVAGSGGGMSVTVDFQKATGSGSWASVLSAVLTINSATAIGTAVVGTITTPSYAAGDRFRAVVVATAGGGTLPQGLVVQARYKENPT